MLTTIIGWIVVGSLCGWFAGFIMRCDTQERILLNIFVGVLGAVAAGAILGRHDIAYGFSIEAFLWSLVGAIAVLVIFNLISRGRFGGRLSK
jgi:uncharacterized membrane protein YeaQ/YmgE (transglycosylase-associated protein family)